MHTLVSRRPNSPRLQEETTVMHAVLNEMRKEFDLLPDDSAGQCERDQHAGIS